MAGPIAEAAVELVADGTRFGSSARDEIKKGLAGADKDVGKTLDKNLDKAGRSAGVDWSSAFRIAVADRLAGFGIDKLFAPLKGIGLGLGLSVLATQAAAAAASLVQLGAALAPAVGILAAVPATIAVTGAALGTLAVALSGVGEAFGAALGDDAEAFGQALEDLAPSAQTVARELHALAPALDDLRTSVQDAFFAPLAGQIDHLGRALSGPLTDGMSSVAAEMGRTTRGLTEFMAEAETVGFLDDLFDATRQAIGNIGPALRPVLAGFRDLISSTLPGVDSLTSRIGELGTQFGEWLSEAAESGQAMDWISAAVDTFRQLGTIVQQLGGIFHALGSAANEAGGNILDVIGDALRSVNEFLSSAEGQDALVTIFESLARVGASLGPAFAAAAGAIADFAPHAAAITEALGPGLAAAIGAIGTALANLGPGLTDIAEALSDAFASSAVQSGIAELSNAFSGVLSTIAPIVPLISDVAGVIGSTLATAISTLTTILSPVVDAFAWLGDVLSALSGPMGTISDSIGILAGGVAAIIVAVKAWAAVQWALNAALNANPIGLVVTAVAALVGAFIWAWNELDGFRQFWIDLWNGIVELVQPVIDSITNAWTLFVEWWSGVWEEIQGPVTAAWESIKGTIVVAMQAIWETIQGIWTAIVETFSGAWEAIKGIVQGAIDIIKGIIDLFMGALAGDWSLAWEGIKSIVSGVWSAITGVISGALATVKGVITGALSAIAGIFSSVWDGIKNGVSAAWDGIVSGVRSGIDSMMEWISSIPDKVIGFFADAGSWLIEAGKKIITGLIDGIKSMIGSIGDAIGDIANAITDFLPFSPAKRGPLSGRGAPIYSGRSIGRQLADGIAEQRGRVHTEMRRTVRPPAGALRAPQTTARHTSAGVRTALTSGSQINRSTHRQVSIHAPITVQSRAADPEIIARRTADRLAALTQG